MKRLPMTLCFGTLAVLLSAAGPHYIFTAPLEKVVRHIDLVVRGDFDAKTGALRIRKQYGKERKIEKIQVHNAASLPAVLREGKAKHDVILFLRSFDDRYYLPVSTHPTWVTPHAAIKVVGAQGTIMGLHQWMNPGPLALRKEKYNLDELEKKLRTEYKEHIKPLDYRFLKPKALERFRAASEPWIDYYERKIKRKPSHRQFAELLDRLSALATEKSPTMRFQVTRSLLTLGNQNGFSQPRRDAFEKRLVSLVKKLGHQRLMAALMADLESHDLRANERSAARVIRSMGDKQVNAAKNSLLAFMKKTKKGTLRTNAYFALIYLGCEEEAKKAN